MTKLVLGFAGEMSSGKGSAAGLVMRWYPGTRSFRFSDSLREFYALLLAEFPQLHVNKIPALFGDRLGPRLVGILRSAFCSDLGASASHYIQFREFEYWLVGRFMPEHHGVWPKDSSTADLQALSTAVRRFFGEDTLERAVMSRVAHSGDESPCVVIEGIRRLVDITTLMKDPEDRFRLMYIEALPRTRFERHVLRNEKPGDSEFTFEQFLELGKAEAEEQIRLLRPHAHAVIKNNGTRTSFEIRLQRKVDRFLRDASA